eukprot:403332868
MITSQTQGRIGLERFTTNSSALRVEDLTNSSKSKELTPNSNSHIIEVSIIDEDGNPRSFVNLKSADQNITYASPEICSKLNISNQSSNKRKSTRSRSQKHRGISTIQKSQKTLSVDHYRFTTTQQDRSDSSSKQKIGSTMQSKILNKLRNRNRELIQQLNPNYFHIYNQQNQPERVIDTSPYMNTDHNSSSITLRNQFTTLNKSGNSISGSPPVARNLGLGDGSTEQSPSLNLSESVTQEELLMMGCEVSNQQLQQQFRELKYQHHQIQHRIMQNIQNSNSKSPNEISIQDFSIGSLPNQDNGGLVSDFTIEGSPEFVNKELNPYLDNSNSNNKNHTIIKTQSKQQASPLKQVSSQKLQLFQKSVSQISKKNFDFDLLGGVNITRNILRNSSCQSTAIKANQDALSSENSNEKSQICSNNQKKSIEKITPPAIVYGIAQSKSKIGEFKVENNESLTRPEIIFRKSRPTFIVNNRNVNSSHTTISNQSQSQPRNNLNTRLEELSKERLDDKKTRDAIYEINGIIDKINLGEQIKNSRKGTPTFSISRSLQRKRFSILQSRELSQNSSQPNTSIVSKQNQRHQLLESQWSNNLVKIDQVKPQSTSNLTHSQSPINPVLNALKQKFLRVGDILKHKENLHPNIQIQNIIQNSQINGTASLEQDSKSRESIESVSGLRSIIHKSRVKLPTIRKDAIIFKSKSQNQRQGSQSELLMSTENSNKLTQEQAIRSSVNVQRVVYTKNSLKDANKIIQRLNISVNPNQQQNPTANQIR